MEEKKDIIKSGQVSEKKKANKVGRPETEVDWRLVEGLANIHCTQEEIATALGNISVRSLMRKAEFRRLYKKGNDMGKVSLRRKMFRAADEGNTAMMIFLSKNILGYKDKTDLDIDQDIHIKIKVSPPDEY